MSITTGFLAFQMQMVARGWLVYEMTDSPLALGLVSVAWGLSTLLLSPFGGLIADRVEKRNLIIIGQALTALLSLAVGILIAVKAIQLWHLIAASFIDGMILSLTMPARQAIIPELVGRTRLLNAIAFNSTGMNITRIVGPILAGFLVKPISVSGVYFIIAGLYLSAIVTMRNVPTTGTAAKIQQASIIKDIAGGFSYVRHHPLLITLLTLEFVVNLLGAPYATLMPVFARDVLGVGAAGLGTLVSASGVGALLGSLGLAFLGNFRRKGLLLLGFIIVFGGGLILFSNSGLFLISLLLLLVIGGASTACFTMNNTLIQMNTSQEVRGRVMSIYMTMWTGESFGTLPVSAIAGIAGAPLTVSACGLLLALLAVGTLFAVPNLRRAE
jgi:MFS family permease